MTAKEARALMPDIKNINEVLRQIKIQAEYGENYTYAKFNQTTFAKLIELGYSIETKKYTDEYRISW